MSESRERQREREASAGPCPPVAKSVFPFRSALDPEALIRYLIAGALLLLSLLALLVAAIGFVAAPSLLAVAYVMARVRLAVGTVGEDERWLLYPTLLLGDAILFGAILLWPLAVAILLGRWRGLVAFYPPFLGPAPAAGSFGYWYQVIAVALMAMGAWWTLLGGMMIRRPAAMRLLLRPFLQSWVPELGRWVIPTGIVAVVIGAIALLVLTW